MVIVSLYLVARAVRGCGGGPLCDKIYLLNRALSGVDLFYEVRLPDVFFFDHPLGSVIGRAEFRGPFNFLQGCTVGNNKGVYPSFGSYVFMCSDAKVLGACSVGDYVIFAANSYVKDTDIPAGSIVFGQSPNLVVKEGCLDYVRSYARGVFFVD